MSGQRHVQRAWCALRTTAPVRVASGNYSKPRSMVRMLPGPGAASVLQSHSWHQHQTSRGMAFPKTRTLGGLSPRSGLLPGEKPPNPLQGIHPDILAEQLKRVKIEHAAWRNGLVDTESEGDEDGFDQEDGFHKHMRRFQKDRKRSRFAALPGESKKEQTQRVLNMWKEREEEAKHEDEHGVPLTLRNVGNKKSQRLRLPAHVNARYLSGLLRLTLEQTNKLCRRAVRWWPAVTSKQLKKDPSRVDGLVLTFQEAARVVALQGHAAELVDTERDPQESNPLKPHKVPRAPVIAVLGHIDHGKTTLIDCLAQTNVAVREPGGITQDVRCISIALDNKTTVTQKGDKESTVRGDIMTFIDTPGHEVFDSMRAVGSFFADAMVVVIDVNEGVHQQTAQSLAFAQHYNIPIVLALNQVDRLGLDARSPEAMQHERVKSTLEEVKELGWQIVSSTEEARRMHLYSKGMALPVTISAKYGHNVQTLVDSLLQICRDNTKPHHDKNAYPAGAVIDSFLEDGGRGRVVRVVLKRGVLSKGDHFAAGMYAGVVKGMRQLPTFAWIGESAHEKAMKEPRTEAKEAFNHVATTPGGDARHGSVGHLVDEAVPGVPVEIMGMSQLARTSAISTSKRRRKGDPESATMDPPMPGDAFLGRLHQRDCELIAFSRRMQVLLSQSERVQVEDSDGSELGTELAHLSDSAATSASEYTDEDDSIETMPRRGGGAEDIEWEDERGVHAGVVRIPVILRAANGASLEALFALCDEGPFPIESSMTETLKQLDLTGVALADDVRAVKVAVVKSGLGRPTPSDLTMAAAVNGMVVSYKITKSVTPSLRKMATEKKVPMVDLHVFSDMGNLLWNHYIRQEAAKAGVREAELVAAAEAAAKAARVVQEI